MSLPGVVVHSTPQAARQNRGACCQRVCHWHFLIGVEFRETHVHLISLICAPFPSYLNALLCLKVPTSLNSRALMFGSRNVAVKCIPKQQIYHSTAPLLLLESSIDALDRRASSMCSTTADPTAALMLSSILFTSLLLRTVTLQDGVF